MASRRRADRLALLRGRRGYRVWLIAIAAGSVALTLLAYGFDTLRKTDLNSVDWRFTVRGEREAPRDIVFVKIDDATFNRLRSQFPFPRGYHADVIDNLAADGARAIAYDVQFTEPGPDPKADNRLILAVRRAGNVVLATTEVSKDGRTRIFGGGQGLAFSRGTPSSAVFPEDPGGTFRRSEFSDRGLPTFSVATARMVDPGLDQPDGKSFWIDFPGPPGTIESIPFWRVAKGRFPPHMFRNKIAVVGSSSISLQDLHPTSTTGDQPMPGPEIQASAIDTALRGFPLSRAPGWTAVLLIILAGSMTPLLALRYEVPRAVLVALGAGALYLIAAQLLFNSGHIVSVVYPSLAALLSMTGAVVLYALVNAIERLRTRDAFARFVPESVVGRVLDQADGMRLGGTSVEMTILFSDLRGFTSFSERRAPDLVISILNRYLEAMSDAILDNGGTLVCYMGDGIMAVFGAPIHQPDHADRALAAAVDMLDRMHDFNAWMRDEGYGDGFKMGIGLNTGPAISGNVGSERRLEYTVIGDTTNTSARLEGMTKGTPHQLFMAGSTKEALTNPPEEAVPVGDFEVRGREAKIAVWTLPSCDHREVPPDPADSEGPEAAPAS